MAFEILIQALTTFWSEYATSNLFIETFIKEKATCWYHTNQNLNNEVLHHNNFSFTVFDQSGLNNYITHKKISLRPKISTSIDNEQHFLFWIELTF